MLEYPYLLGSSVSSGRMWTPVLEWMSAQLQILQTEKEIKVLKINLSAILVLETKK